MTHAVLSGDLRYFTDLDARLVAAASAIKVLSALAWPAKHYHEFMDSWEKGNPRLPAIEYPRVDLSDRCQELQHIIEAAGSSHPIGDYIAQTADSYIAAARMLEHAGHPEFSRLSQLLYGTPFDTTAGESNLALAEAFLTGKKDLSGLAASAAGDPISPEAVAAELGQEAARFFHPHKISVVVDHNLTAKAAAGSERVRIRGMTTFTRAEVDQLREHELYVHSATRLNGREQPFLKSLCLGAPRTVCTQEGLATYAEFITKTMDRNRLCRIALRIKAISMALEGGDFIDVFRFFLSLGQSERESFQSAARVFRGGDVRGRHVFTKDVVYLQGLVSVQNFLAAATAQGKTDYPRYLFLGRLTLADIPAFEPFIRSGYIVLPRYVPDWVHV